MKLSSSNSSNKDPSSLTHSPAIFPALTPTPSLNHSAFSKTWCSSNHNNRKLSSSQLNLRRKRRRRNHHRKHRSKHHRRFSSNHNRKRSLREVALRLLSHR